MAVNPMLVGGIGVGVTAAAVTGGLYAGGVIGGGSSASQPNTQSLEKPMPTTWRTAADDKDAGTKYGDGKYANKYQKYLAGAGEAETNKIDNEDWWEWSYENRYLKDKGTEGFAEGKIKSKEALENACGAAYGGTAPTTGNTDITVAGSGGNSATTKYPEEEVWKYCSPSKTKITTVEDANKATEYSGNEKYGNKYKDKLVYKDNNDWFWNLKEEELKKATLTAANTSSKFKDLQTKLNGTNTEKITLKAVCDDAYKQDNSTETENTQQYPKTEIFQFCSLSGSKPD